MKIRVGVDWGSSSFRAYRYDDALQAVEEIVADCGIKFVEENAFEQVLFDHIGDWLQQKDGVLLSGMITSRNGWVETPYVNCPVNPALLVNGAIQTEVRNHPLVFLPGVAQSLPSDVMRGEELQMLGADLSDAPHIAVFPGTHSKWISTCGDRLNGFRTIATGEIFEMLIKHTLIGNLCDSNAWNDTSFLNGVERGYQTQTVISDLFSCRSAVLLDQQSAGAAYAWLSGLLIGNEIREGVADFTTDEAMVLIGNERLCNRYRSALEQIGIDVVIAPADAAARGYAKLITTLQG